MALYRGFMDAGGSGNLQEKTVYPIDHTQIIRPDIGYDGLKKVTVNGINLNSSTFIKILDVTGNHIIHSILEDGWYYISRSVSAVVNEASTIPGFENEISDGEVYMQWDNSITILDDATSSYTYANETDTMIRFFTSNTMVELNTEAGRNTIIRGYRTIIYKYEPPTT